MATVLAVQSSATSGKRVAPLDGWRGVAVLLVLVYHSHLCLFGDQWSKWCPQTGQHGVTIFFVLSGYLITANLIQHPNSLKQFYVRRVFRLMPVAWAYLAALVLISLIFRVRVTSFAEIRACLLFYRNYSGPFSWMDAQHFWSLSMEEQFYILWPTVLLLAGFKRARWVAGAGALLVAGWRFILWSQYERFPFYMRTEVRADALLVGCLLALLLIDYRELAFAVTRWAAWPALAVLVFCIMRYQNLTPLYEDVVIATLIAAAVLHGETRLSRILASKALVWCGMISYSLYVWQALWMDPRLPREMTLFVIPCAIGSYYWIERPCKRLGHKYTPHGVTVSVA